MSDDAYLECFDHDRVYLVGALTFNTVGELLERGQQSISQRPKLCFDLAKVVHADSAGVSLLVNLLRFAKEQESYVYFANIPAQVLDIIRISGLTDILSFGEEATCNNNA